MLDKREISKKCDRNSQLKEIRSDIFKYRTPIKAYLDDIKQQLLAAKSQSAEFRLIQKAE